MATMAEITLDMSKLPKEKFFKGKKGIYYTFNITLQDDTRYGNNISVFDKQSKEERDAKKPKEFLGSGKVFWTDGNVSVAEREDKPKQADPMDSLPF
jgi:hypothetical protein